MRATFSIYDELF